MSDTRIRDLLQQNAEIVAADEEVTALLRRLRELHREGGIKRRRRGCWWRSWNGSCGCATNGTAIFSGGGHSMMSFSVGSMLCDAEPSLVSLSVRKADMAWVCLGWKAAGDVLLRLARRWLGRHEVIGDLLVAEEPDAVAQVRASRITPRRASVPA